MTKIIINGKAEQLRNEASRIASAIRLLNNSQFDLHPNQNRVVLSQAPLPGFNGKVFEGEARLCSQGAVLTLGVRSTGNCGGITEVILKRREGLTSITERNYRPGLAKTFVVNAEFNAEGRLTGYAEEVCCPV